LTASEFLGASYFKAQGQISDSTLGYALFLVNSGTFVGAIMLGTLSDKIGTKKALMIGNILVVAACGLLASMMPGNVEWLMVSVFLIGAFQGAQMASLLRMYMELSPSNVGGTMFAAYTSVSNAGMAVLGSITISLISPIVGAAYSMLSVIPYVIMGSLMLRMMKLYAPAPRT
jgi:MFS-type transporter involved in bile tolerance (Atg22 family)